MSELVERDNRIKLLRESGKTLQEIGDMFGVSRERIRQICDDIPFVRKVKKLPTRKYPIGYKKCYKCKKVLSLNTFEKNSSTKDGFGNLCKECASLKQRERSYRRYYGITLDDYEEMYEEQNGKCYICGNRHTILCVDHNHKTGKVRSLLCRRCNHTIGGIEENIRILESMIKYIEMHKTGA